MNVQLNRNVLKEHRSGQPIAQDLRVRHISQSFYLFTISNLCRARFPWDGQLPCVNGRVIYHCRILEGTIRSVLSCHIGPEQSGRLRDHRAQAGMWSKSFLRFRTESKRAQNQHPSSKKSSFFKQGWRNRVVTAHFEGGKRRLD